MLNLLRDRWSKLSGEQRLATTALSVCCLLFLVGGVSQLRSHVRKPFLVSRGDLTKAIQIRTQNFEQEEKAARALKLKDTDRDGISDYDEIYMYKTSPYLADSDSDGLSDAQEIAQGTDPNCPEGRNCFDLQTSLPQVATSTFVAAADAGLAAARAEASGAAQTGVEGFIMNPQPPETMNAAQTRAYILAQGLLPPDQLQNLPDASILQAYRLSYQEALRIQAARAATASSTPSLQPTP